MSGSSYLVPPDVAWAEQPGGVVVARLPDGPPLVLVGSSEAIWRAAVAGPGDAAAVTARVARQVGAEAAAVAPDVARFLAELVGRGLLVQEDSSNESR